MSVLTLAGKPIDWTNPPKSTARVLWYQKDIYADNLLRVIAGLSPRPGLVIGT